MKKKKLKSMSSLRDAPPLGSNIGT